jgi:hypothetical protein
MCHKVYDSMLSAAPPALPKTSTTVLKPPELRMGVWKTCY